MSGASSTGAGMRPFPVIAITLMVLMLLGAIALTVGLPQQDVAADGSGESGSAEAKVEPFDVASAPVDLAPLRETKAFQPPRPSGPIQTREKLLAGYELRGTVVNDDGGFALMAKPGDEAVTVVSKNRSLDGWRLIGLAPDRAVFRKGDRMVTLVLE